MGIADFGLGGAFAVWRRREAPYTSIAKRYTFTYTRMRMELDHEKLDVYVAALDFAAWAHTVFRT